MRGQVRAFKGGDMSPHSKNSGNVLQWIGVTMAITGLVFQAAGIVMRCLIAGRPPVTNMYESIIWVSFAVSFFGMIFFARYRASVYLLAALPVTLIALLLVHQMPIAMPSSIDPLVPVLRDNFWLTVHVLTITLRYAAFALAIGFGHILLLAIRAKSRGRTRRCISGFIACSSSVSYYSRLAQFSAEYGQIIPRAGSGAGTRKKHGR